MKVWSSCLFINLFLYVSANAQQATSPLPTENPVPAKLDFKRSASDSVTIHNKPFTGLLSNTLTPVSPLYYESTLGFFCKKELQLEKAIKFPVKFRLGSVAYTDKMEGKTH